MTATYSKILDDAFVDQSVRAVHPLYTAFLIVAEEIQGGDSDERSEELLSEAEAVAKNWLAKAPIESLEHIVVWREAFSSFGCKPRVARSSVEALLRRAETGLPRINLLTDIYNAISVKHGVPIGGEDLSGYRGAPRLVIADGTEVFDTVADGQPVVVQVADGEPVWRDDVGVTCRRWNWRQCVRTRLSTSTTDALFIIDGLGESGSARASLAADELCLMIKKISPAAAVDVRQLS